MASTARNFRVLLVDGDRHSAFAMRDALTAHFSCDVAVTGDDASRAIAKDEFDVVVSRHELDGTNGFDLLATAKESSPSTRVILVGSDASTPNLLEAGRRGAYDFLLWPVEQKLLYETVDRATLYGTVERSPSRPPPAPRPFAPGAIIGTSAALMEALASVDRVAHSTAPVLIVGETGTGKDLLAARIHARGPRRHRPYVVVNAGAIPATLLDSELFGHVAGAFTGATKARRGLVVEADGGTLFLDEIVDLPIELQGRLLRVLEAKAVRPVGGDHERQVDVRFVAATQRDLSHAVRAGTFREDLYFRLNVLAIQVPALRARRDDLAALIQYFFDDARVRNPRSPVSAIAPAVHEALLAYPWPGNVRELQACIERLVVLGKTARIEERDLAAVQVAKSPPQATAVEEATELEDLLSLRDMTSQYVERVLARTSGDKARAARILGIDVSTLYRWLRRQPIVDKRRRPKD